MLQLIENWPYESSISGVIDVNGMIRREYFGEVDKWIFQPRFIGKVRQRIHFF